VGLVLTEINISTGLDTYILQVPVKGASMRAFAIAIAALIVIAVGGWYLLDKTWQQTADQSFSSPTYVRFPHDEAGHNLVGKDWSSAKEH
jgi:hypothetical protein